jgi:uncharacterized C2H2 Zn-finger protein
MHSKVKNNKCPQCWYLLSESGNLSRHIKCAKLYIIVDKRAKIKRRKQYFMNMNVRHKLQNITFFMQVACHGHTTHSSIWMSTTATLTMTTADCGSPSAPSSAAASGSSLGDFSRTLRSRGWECTQGYGCSHSLQFSDIF